jgi:hypothetical protein
MRGRAAAAVFALIFAASCASGVDLDARRGRAAAALSALEAGGGAGSGAGIEIKRDKRGKPNWVDHPESAYPKARFLSATGYGSSRRQAEQNALGNLAAVFGQSVQSNLETIESYREQVEKGAIAVETSVRAEQAVRTTAALDSLIGAEIADVWEDGASCYAVALMDKALCREIYAGLFEANERLIAGALERSARSRGAIEEAAGYYYAARLSDVNAVFATVLAVLGEPGYRGVKRGDEYRSQAKKAAREIPVSVTVAGDKNGKLRAAFANALLREGFSTGSGASRYVLEVETALEPLTLPNENKWTRWTVDARFTDREKGRVLFPFSISGREGHISQTEADNRAITDAALKIQDEYAAAFNAYLAGAAG